MSGSNGMIFWGSDADSTQSGDAYNMTRYVINRDPNGPRRIDWPVARLRVEALPPNYIAALCQRGLIGCDRADGALYFARDGSQVQTTIYIGHYEPQFMNTVFPHPLTLVSEFSLRPVGGDGDSMRLRFTSAFEKGRSWLRYTIENDGTLTTELRIFLPDQVRKELVGTGFPSLRSGAAASAVVRSGELPGVMAMPIAVLSSTGTLIASFEALMFVPEEWTPAPGRAAGKGR